ncbi:MAG: acyloxyacyl hydrolase [Candidatus Omnitrophota bacterium]|jgi:hypothetical protein
MNRIALIITILAVNLVAAGSAFAASEPAAITFPEQAQAFAEEVAQGKPKETDVTVVKEEKCLIGIEFLSGYGRANKIRRKEDIKEIPFMVDFDLNLKPLLKKINLNPPVLAQFQIEPFVTDIYEPVNENIEGGLAFWFKFGLLPESFKIQPYAKFGAGFDYMTLHTINQATQFNFISQLACGVHYFFLKNTALTIEGHYRHLSNAGIKEPNRGINTYFILGGLTWRY